MQTLLTIVVSILTSGTIAGVINYFLSDRRHRRDVRREKLETLYESAHTYKDTLDSFFLYMEFFLRGKISYKEAMEMATKDETKKNVVQNNYVKMRIIANLYFPDLTKTIDEIYEIRGTAVTLLTKASQEGGNDAVMAHPEDHKVFREALQRLDERFDAFENEVSAQSLRIT